MSADRVADRITIELSRADAEHYAGDIHRRPRSAQSVRLTEACQRALSDSDPVGRPGQAQGDQHWPETSAPADDNGPVSQWNNAKAPTDNEHGTAAGAGWPDRATGSWGGEAEDRPDLPPQAPQVDLPAPWPTGDV